jgi:twitching motility protein PilT
MGVSSVASNQNLARLLSQQGLLPDHVLDGLINKARTLQEWIGEVAVDEGMCTYLEIATAISRQLKLPLVNLATVKVDPNVLERVSIETCKQRDVLPTGIDPSHLYLAMANPLDEDTLRTLRDLYRVEIVTAVVPLDDLRKSIDIWYRNVANQRTAQGQPTQPSFTDRGATAVMSSFSATLTNMAPESIGVDELLSVMFENKASDLHLAVGSPPMMRVHGELMPMNFPVLNPTAIQTMLYAILTDVQITQFERHWELDFAYSIPGMSRFRVNIHRQRGTVGGVLRTIPVEIPSLDTLRMPRVIREFTERPRGLVLVTGPTGSGKSTTLAAMIDEINRTKRTHIVTIEDPIEFLHKNKMSVITQREVGADTESFTTALRHVLRQDPDVILIGEMRDLETIAAALTAAETGHLVYATLHTTSAAQTVDRIVDVFPPHQQEQIRAQLATVLEGIVCQTLLPVIDGKGRACAQEILVGTSAVRTLIREGKGHQITSVLQASAKYGMCTLDASLRDLVLSRRVSFDEAVKKSSNPEDFKALVAMQ